MSKINEFKYPDKAVDYNNLPKVDNFWGWSIKRAADAAGMEELITASGQPLKSVSSVILWLNKVAYAWKSGMHESGDSKMSIKDFRKIVREELEKVYKQKVAKEAPKTETQRKETDEDKVKLNTQANDQIKQNGSSNPTDAEWKKLRTAQLEVPVPTMEEQKAYENEMMEGLKKDLPKIAEECKKLGDKELNGLVKDALYTFAEMHLGRKKVRYYEMKNSLAAIGKRLISLGSFKKSNIEKDDKKFNKDIEGTKDLITKYLKKQEMKAPKKEKLEEQSTQPDEHTDMKDMYYGRILRLADELGEFDKWLKYANQVHPLQDLVQKCEELEARIANQDVLKKPFTPDEKKYLHGKDESINVKEEEEIPWGLVKTTQRSPNSRTKTSDNSENWWRDAFLKHNGKLSKSAVEKFRKLHPDLEKAFNDLLNDYIKEKGSDYIWPEQQDLKEDEEVPWGVVKTTVDTPGNTYRTKTDDRSAEWWKDAFLKYNGKISKSGVEKFKKLHPALEKAFDELLKSNVIQDKGGNFELPGELKEEFDSWTCMECHYVSPKRFNKCPKCGSQEIENLG